MGWGAASSCCQMGRATHLVDLNGGVRAGTAKTTCQSRIKRAGSSQMSTRMDLTLVVVPVPLQRLPIGVQIIAPPWREDVALPIAYSLEKAGAASAAAGRVGETMQIGLPVVVAAVRSAFERYEQAQVSNNVASSIPCSITMCARSGMASPRTCTGMREVAAFRARRLPQGLSRTRDKTVITTYGHDFAVASTLFYRDSTPGKVGRQMQTWVRLPEGWRIVAAHVSLIDDPAKC